MVLRSPHSLFSTPLRDEEAELIYHFRFHPPNPLPTRYNTMSFQSQAAPRILLLWLLRFSQVRNRSLLARVYFIPPLATRILELLTMIQVFFPFPVSGVFPPGKTLQTGGAGFQLVLFKIIKSLLVSPDISFPVVSKSSSHLNPVVVLSFHHRDRFFPPPGAITLVLIASCFWRISLPTPPPLPSRDLTLSISR